MENDKNCGHKCEQCVREEISKLNDKISELEKLLPPKELPIVPYVPYTPPMLPPVGPYWYCGDPNITLCNAGTGK